MVNSVSAPSLGPLSLLPGSQQRPAARVAVIDADPSVRALVAHWLKADGYEVEEFESGANLRDLGRLPDMACVDWGAGGSTGLEVVRLLHAAEPDLPVVVITSRKDAETAVSVMRAGAYDCVTKPLDSGRLLLAMGRARERHELLRSVRRLESELTGRALAGVMSGASSAVRALSRHVDRVVNRDVPVCLLGEIGSGTELVARAIHQGSTRAGGPFVSFDCSACEQSDHEVHLFGRDLEGGRIVRGAVEQANGGVLHIDHIGYLSPAAQATLLLLLGSRAMRRAGGAEEVSVNIRIIVSSDVDLRELVDRGDLREELYYRLAVYPIHVPALRERREDIPGLLGHLLRVLGKQMGASDAFHLTADAIETLRDYPWPGNIQELENVIQRVILSSATGTIGAGDLPPEIRLRSAAGKPANENSGPRPVGINGDIVPLRELERRAIEHALRVTGGSVAVAAKRLGIGRATLYRRIASLDLKSDVA